jgi:alanine dehydrogenase
VFLDDSKLGVEMHSIVTGGFLLIREDEARQTVTAQDLIPAMEEGLRAFSARELVHPQRSALFVGENASFFGLMPAYVPSTSSLGAKLITVFESNRKRSLPTHFALVLLLDPETGALRALVDGAYVTEARTAAVSMVAVRHLGKQPIRRAAVFGAGVQARGHVEAMADEIGTLEEVAVWSVDDLQGFVERTSGSVRCRVRQARSAEDAARGADLLVLVTSTADPVIRKGWVSPGALVISVGACRPDNREIDPALLKDARLIVDSKQSALVESGDVMLGISEGRFGTQHIAGELGDVIAGRVPGRVSPGQVVVFKSLGLAVEDVLAAEIVYSRAVERGLGQLLSMSKPA